MLLGVNFALSNCFLGKLKKLCWVNKLNEIKCVSYTFFITGEHVFVFAVILCQIVENNYE